MIIMSGKTPPECPVEQADRLRDAIVKKDRTSGGLIIDSARNPVRG